MARSLACPSRQLYPLKVEADTDLPALGQDGAHGIRTTRFAGDRVGHWCVEIAELQAGAVHAGIAWGALVAALAGNSRRATPGASTGDATRDGVTPLTSGAARLVEEVAEAWWAAFKAEA